MTAPLLVAHTMVANTQYGETEIPLSQGAASEHEAKTYHVSMFGTWDTATLKLRWSPDGGVTWFDILEKTANFQGTVVLGPGTIDFDMSSVGASTDVDASISG